MGTGPQQAVNVSSPDHVIAAARLDFASNQSVPQRYFFRL